MSLKLTSAKVCSGMSYVIKVPEYRCLGILLVNGRSAGEMGTMTCTLKFSTLSSEVGGV